MTAARIDPNELTPANPDGAATSLPDFYNVVIAAINEHADEIDAEASAANGYINVQHYGAAGDGVSDDSAGIRLALAAANATGGGVVFFPPGTYIVSQDGANHWCLSVPSNVTIYGVRRHSTIKAKAGLGNAVHILRADNVERVAFRDLIIDGNWGNAITAIAAASDGTSKASSTFNVDDTTGFPSSGTFTVVGSDNAQVIAYTGKTSVSFTGCTGGSGTLIRGDAIVYVDSQATLNYSGATVITNHLIALLGARKVTIENCDFKQAYGDGIYLGLPSNGDLLQWTRDVRIANCTFSTNARNGITLGQSTDGVTVEDCIIETPFAQAFDTEPAFNTFVARNVRLLRCRLNHWANPYSHTTNSPLSIAGGSSSAPGPENYARGYRVENCVIEGSVLITDAVDVVFNHNRVRCDWGGASDEPVQVQGFSDNVTIEGNEIYTRTSGHVSAITLVFQAVDRQPAGVRVANNKIYARGGTTQAIFADGTGGQSNGIVGMYTPINGTATATTATSMTDSTKTWTAGQWATWRVRMGTAEGSISTNTATGLVVNGWFEPYSGRAVPTPPPGSYRIYQITGCIDIIGNEIDCTDDGHGNGGKGIVIADDRGGVRCRVLNNKVKNANAYGIYAIANDPNRPFTYLEIADNIGWDDQASPTMTELVHLFTDNLTDLSAGKLIVRNNIVTGPASFATLGGPSASTLRKTWMVHDGATQEWTGYGTPETVVTAPVGSSYRRIDGAAGTLQYNKISGTGNTGWRAIPGGTETIASGACTPSVQATLINTSGTVAYTLADGDATLDGVVKRFLVISANGTPAGTLTPTHLADGTTHTITWSATGSFELMWDHANTTWRVVGTPRGGTVN